MMGYLCNCVGRRHNNGDLEIYGPCVLTGRAYTINTTEKEFVEGMRKYEAGALIQRAFPFLSKEDREFLMSGMTPESWRQTFSPQCHSHDQMEHQN